MHGLRVVVARNCKALPQYLELQVSITGNGNAQVEVQGKKGGCWVARWGGMCLCHHLSSIRPGCWSCILACRLQTLDLFLHSCKGRFVSCNAVATAWTLPWRPACRVASRSPVLGRMDVYFFRSWLVWQRLHVVAPESWPWVGVAGCIYQLSTFAERSVMYKQVWYSSSTVKSVMWILSGLLR